MQFQSHSQRHRPTLQSTVFLIALCCSQHSFASYSSFAFPTFQLQLLLLQLLCPKCLNLLSNICNLFFVLFFAILFACCLLLFSSLIARLRIAIRPLPFASHSFLRAPLALVRNLFIRVSFCALIGLHFAFVHFILRRTKFIFEYFCTLLFKNPYLGLKASSRHSILVQIQVLLACNLRPLIFYSTTEFSFGIRLLFLFLFGFYPSFASL